MGTEKSDGQASHVYDEILGLDKQLDESELEEHAPIYEGLVKELQNELDSPTE